MTTTTTTATRSTKAASALTRNFYFLTEDGRNVRSKDTQIVSIVRKDGTFERVRDDAIVDVLALSVAKGDIVEERNIAGIVLKRKDSVLYVVDSARYIRRYEDGKPCNVRWTLEMLIRKPGQKRDEVVKLEQIIDAKGVHTRFHLLDAETEGLRACAAQEDLV